MRNHCSQFFQVILMIVSCAIAAADDQPRKMKLPISAESADGKKLVAPLDFTLRAVHVDLVSGARTEMPNWAYDGTFNSDNQQFLTVTGALADVTTGKVVRLFRAGQEQIQCARFSPDFQKVITGSTDHVVRVWDAASGIELAKLEGHAEDIVCVEIDSKNQLALSASRNDGAIRIWDWKQKKLLHTITAHAGNLDKARFSSDGRYLITGGWNESVRIWKTESGEQVGRLDCPEKIIGLAVNPKKGQIATYNQYLDHTVRIWDIETGGLQYTLEHSRSDDPGLGFDAVRAVAFSPDGERIVTCGKEAIVWDVNNGKELVRIPTNKKIQAVFFRPNGSQFVGATKESIDLWDATTGELVKSIVNFMAIDLMSISPDGEKICAAGAHFSAAVWDCETGQKDFELKGAHSWQIYSLAFSPGRARIATGSFDQTAKLWDGTTGALIAVMSGHLDRVQYVTFSPSGRYLFTGTGPNENRGYIWDGNTGERIAELKGHTDKVLHAKFSRNEKWVLTGSNDNSARLWEVATGKELHQFQHGSTIVAVEFSPNDNQVLTVSSGRISEYWTTPGGYRMNEGSSHANEHSARLWNRETGVEMFRFDHPDGASASFSEDGTKILLKRQGMKTAWNAQTGEELPP